MKEQVIAPHSVEAELSLIGSLMLDPDMMERVAAIQANDFYLAQHQEIYAAMLDAWEAGEPLDYVSIGDRVPDARSVLADAISSTPTSAHAEYYARQVQRYSILRQYISMSTELVKQAYQGSSPDELFVYLQDKLKSLDYSDTPNALMTWEESFVFQSALLAQFNEPEQASDWSWPWASWNKVLGVPPEPGMLTLLAAGDGMGKTLYAECIAEHWARQGKRVVFCHFELNRSIMMQRRLCRTSNLPLVVIRAPNKTEATVQQIEVAESQMRLWAGRIEYLKCEGWTIDKLVKELRQLIAAGDCDVFIVDYLEKAQPSRRQATKYHSKWEYEADDVEQLKTLAEATETRALVLSQFNKQGKTQASDQMNRTSIRGAGEKTEKSNIVILLNREKAEHGETLPDGTVIVEPGGYSRLAHLRVDKNTLGRTGAFTQFIKAETFSVFDTEGKS